MNLQELCDSLAKCGKEKGEKWETLRQRVVSCLKNNGGVCLWDRGDGGSLMVLVVYKNRIFCCAEESGKPSMAILARDWAKSSGVKEAFDNTKIPAEIPHARTFPVEDVLETTEYLSSGAEYAWV